MACQLWLIEILIVSMTLKLLTEIENRLEATVIIDSLAVFNSAFLVLLFKLTIVIVVIWKVYPMPFFGFQDLAPGEFPISLLQLVFQSIYIKTLHGRHLVQFARKLLLFIYINLNVDKDTSSIYNFGFSS
jgi:hypothetical protein